MTHFITLLLGLIFLVTRVTAVQEWSVLPSLKIYAMRSQRDVSANVSIDQFVTPGVRLSNSLFKSEGYTKNALVDFRGLLNAGIESFVIDIYWNHNLQQFQLCPIALGNSTTDFTQGIIQDFDDEDQNVRCQYGLSLQDLIETVSQYTEDTGTNLSANLLLLIFNLYNLDTDTVYPDSILGNTNDTLSAILSNTLTTKLYGPKSLQDDRAAGTTINLNGTTDSSGFPSLNDFLFDTKARVIPLIWENKIPTNVSYEDSNLDKYVFNQSDLGTSFVSSLNTTTLVTNEEILDRAGVGWSFTYDDEENQFTEITINNMLSNGYLPIVNHSFSNVSYLPTFLNDSLWSWESSQPMNEADARRLYLADDSTDANKPSQTAFQCAGLEPDGFWHVSNCYQSKPIVCRHIDDQFIWILNTKKDTYFNAPDLCDGNYTFTVPKTSFQQTSLINYLKRVNVNESVWIDMNSIAIQDCWVSGGPYASCPYQSVSGRRNFVKMLTPAAAVCFALLFSIILLRLRKIPVQDNRKHWKKLLNYYAENEYEGVPS